MSESTVLDRPSADTIGVILKVARDDSMMAFMARSKHNPNRQRRRSSQPIAATTSATTSKRMSVRPVNAKTAARPASTRSNVRPIGRTKSKLRPMTLADQSLPAWLEKLLKVNQRAWIGTIALSLCTMGIYGWSVYSQQQWGQAYRTLEQLRRNERQLISNSEMMKNQIAERVDAKNLGLAPQVANDVIFLQPAPRQPPQSHPKQAQPNQSSTGQSPTDAATGASGNSQPASSTTPLGY